uniref:Uncharacterized protein n=1 Tax=Plectus sambesii TaxID=2011161 RepID=A0A914WQZ1_9BILA
MALYVNGAVAFAHTRVRPHVPAECIAMLQPPHLPLPSIQRPYPRLPPAPGGANIYATIYARPNAHKTNHRYVAPRKAIRFVRDKKADATLR